VSRSVAERDHRETISVGTGDSTMSEGEADTPVGQGLIGGRDVHGGEGRGLRVQPG
jgi:hypothetical protein